MCLRTYKSKANGLTPTQHNFGPFSSFKSFPMPRYLNRLEWKSSWEKRINGSWINLIAFREMKMDHSKVSFTIIRCVSARWYYVLFFGAFTSKSENLGQLKCSDGFLSNVPSSPRQTLHPADQGL